MARSMNIAVKVTAAKSPFSNRLVQRHNLIVADMMKKVLEESQHLDMDLILAWCLDAKKSLASHHRPASLLKMSLFHRCFSNILLKNLHLYLKCHSSTGVFQTFC